MLSSGGIASNMGRGKAKGDKCGEVEGRAHSLPLLKIKWKGSGLPECNEA